MNQKQTRRLARDLEMLPELEVLGVFDTQEGMDRLERSVVDCFERYFTPDAPARVIVPSTTFYSSDKRIPVSFYGYLYLRRLTKTLHKETLQRRIGYFMQKYGLDCEERNMT